MRWAGHVAHTGETRNTYSILDVKPEQKRLLGNLGAYGMIILE
jgi:hypothetical protein